MSRTRTKRIAIIAAVFVVAMVVVLVAPDREPPVIVKGNLSAQDIKEIKGAAMKDVHAIEWASVKLCLRQKEFRTALGFLKAYHGLRVKEINAQGPDLASVTYRIGDTTFSWSDVLTRQTNGWQSPPRK